ncbi:MAG: HdeD family acid-resistance protein, partial [Isosphaeraceae bacterium]
MTAPERPKLLQHLWIWTLVSGVASVLIGVLLVWRPFAAVVFAAFLLVSYLLVCGIFQVVF